MLIYKASKYIIYSITVNVLFNNLIDNFNTYKNINKFHGIRIYLEVMYGFTGISFISVISHLDDGGNLDEICQWFNYSGVNNDDYVFGSPPHPYISIIDEIIMAYDW